MSGVTSCLITRVHPQGLGPGEFDTWLTDDNRETAVKAQAAVFSTATEAVLFIITHRNVREWTFDPIR